MSNWICFYKTQKLYEAELMKDKLDTQNIYSVIINKKDSSYNNFGTVEVYVHKSDIDNVKKINPSNVNI